MPMAVLVTRTMPNSASCSGPTVSMTTSSAPRMALNRGRTLARTIIHSGRLVPAGARLTRPSAMRAATSASVSPTGDGAVSGGALTAAGYRPAVCRPAIFTSGTVVMTTVPAGDRCEPAATGTGNTLLWTEGGVTYRLESGLDRDAAIAVAERLGPWSAFSAPDRSWSRPLPRRKAPGAGTPLAFGRVGGRLARMSDATRPATLGELRASGWTSVPVKDEIRRNAVARIAAGEQLIPSVLGYEDTVLPQLENAVLAGHDVIFLGERGQAKTRMIRSLVELLDEWMPIVAGSEINDDPYNPVSRHARDLVFAEGDDTPIAWVHRDTRFGEKLATPDTSIADLIGEVDPIKVAEGRYLSDELTIHYGLVPRTNRGIFAINELPDLAERIQVGLLNVLEERDVQVRGYRIRLPLDIVLIASANPEDYTHRGRIVSPLKDRFGSQVRTHYPKQVDHEIGIMEQERMRFDDEQFKVVVPQYMKEIVAEISRLARRSPDINQRSGVSVRASIANYESLLANAQRRAIGVRENEVVPRVSDLPYVIPSIA